MSIFKNQAIRTRRGTSAATPFVDIFLEIEFLFTYILTTQQEILIISFGGIEMENIGLSVLGGLVGSYVMILGGYYAPDFGLPRLDFAAQLGSKFTQEERLMRAWGMPQVFANGIIFAFIYSGFLYDVLPGAPWFRGLIYGFILWIFAGFVILPVLFRAGLFGLRHEKLGTVGALFSHLAYGVSLGLIYHP